MARSFAGNGTDAWKNKGGKVRRLNFHKIALPAARRTTTRHASAHVVACHFFSDGASLIDALGAPPSAIHFSSSARSLAFCQRSSGSLARHFFTIRSRETGVIGCRADIGCGSAVRIAAIKLARLVPQKGGLPVTIS